MATSRAQPKRWTTADAVEHYGIDSWGDGFADVNDAGHLEIGPGAARIDLKELVDELVERGIDLPLLIRFTDMVQARVETLNGAFAQAIDEYGYQGRYRGVYPIKVNQDRYLVESLLRFGREYHFGLEAGSKPELLAAIAMLDDPEALIVCNGYKDEAYVDTALLASRLGLPVILVVEKPSELRLIVARSRALEIAPQVGIRARLSSRGAGHWEASGGDRSKFGLGARELLEAVEYLQAEDMVDSFVLLHFHLGSQISAIRSIKNALREAGWLYVNLRRMGVPLAYFDVGGGLGVDYDGSRTNFTSSMNYTAQEYANDVVFGLIEVCEQHAIPHPTIVTESGRATVAHHAALVMDVLEVGEFRIGTLPDAPPEGVEPAVRHLFEAYSELTAKNAREVYHDALQYRDECQSLFSLGHLSLQDRVLAEDLFWAICHRVRDRLSDLPRQGDQRKAIERALADTYFCNFSLFQSLPDSWAIGQLFPILPIHRLGEKPTRAAVLADITCDSDGMINRFIDPREVRSTLDLHPMREEPYYLGVFLVGAYQEILGDLHNLFGDTNTVHVSSDGEGGYTIDHVVPGDTVTDVLRYVGYERRALIARIRRASERALAQGRMSREQARELVTHYQNSLGASTYLERR